MISGALLLSGNKEFQLGRHLCRLFWPLLLWTAFYICIIPVLGYGGCLSVREIFSFPFGPVANGHLWFLYVLAGLYLLVPILKPWLQKAKKETIELYLGLWALTLCLPAIARYLDVAEGTFNMLYYMGGYVGYFVLGYYLKAYPHSFKFGWYWIVALLAFASPIIVRVTHASIEMKDLYQYLTLPVAVMCVFWWKMTVTVFAHARASRWLMALSSLTFGVYLIHYFVMKVLTHTWFTAYCPIKSYSLKLVFFILCVVVISWCLSWCLSWLPGSTKLIGYTSRRKAS